MNSFGPGQLSLNILRAQNLYNPKYIGRQDPFVQISIGQQTLETPVIHDTANPEWNFSGVIPLQGNEQVAVVNVWHSGLLGKTLIGSLEIPIQELIGKSAASWYRLSKKDKAEEFAGELCLQATFQLQSGNAAPAQAALGQTRIEGQDSVFDHGIASAANAGAPVFGSGAPKVYYGNSNLLSSNKNFVVLPMATAFTQTSQGQSAAGQQMSGDTVVLSSSVWSGSLNNQSATQTMQNAPRVDVLPAPAQQVLSKGQMAAAQSQQIGEPMNNAAVPQYQSNANRVDVIPAPAQQTI